MTRAAAIIAALLIAALLFASVLAQAPEFDLADDIVSCWTLDEDSGVRYDSAAAGNDLADFNSVAPGEAHQGAASALFVSEESQMLFAEFDFPEQFTLSFFLGRHEEETPAGGVVSNGSFYIYTEANTYSVSTYATGTVFTATLSPAQWTPIVLMYDGVTAWLIAHPGTNLSTTAEIDPGTGFVLGYEPGSEVYYNGLIDEVVLFDRVLDEEEADYLADKTCELLLGGSGEEPAGDYYEVELPSGRVATLTMEATAGEMFAAVGMLTLGAIMLFDTLRDMSKRMRATK